MLDRDPEYTGWNVEPKLVCKEEVQRVKLKEDTKVGKLLFHLRQFEELMWELFKYPNVRECGKDYVQSKYT